MALNVQRVTLDQFEAYIALPEHVDRRFELINGEIFEKKPTVKHGAIAALFALEFGIYLRQNPTARVVVEGRFRPIHSTLLDLIPDIAIVALDQPLVDKGAAEYMPLVVVEIKSPDDSIRRMRDKARVYLANAVHLVLLVIPEKRVIEVYTQDDDFVLVEEDVLGGGDVLPGFTLMVKDVFKV